MTLFQLYLKLRHKGLYIIEKSSDGQFTGGYYTDVYTLNGKEYHVNFDGKLLDDIQVKSIQTEIVDIPKDRGILLKGLYSIDGPIFETIATNK